jgi:glutamate-1-semialdehyde 2,1-aminomutase
MSEFLNPSWFALIPAAGALAWGRRRLQLSFAKHPSLAGHSRWAKRITRWIPGYAYGDEEVFRADGASEAVEASRRQGFFRLAGQFAGHHRG